MSEEGDGGAAFPRPYDPKWDTDEGVQVGMSLRDWFAGQAMMALARTEIGKEGWATVHGVATDAYKLADAMLKARAE